MPLSSDQLRLIPAFFPRASAMRDAYEARFASPRVQDHQRFIWDYWHVPGQYTYIRTYAKWLFSRDLVTAFLRHLRSWGEENLGCNTVTEPWLSYYVDGCSQELHTDALQGPWAYVFSLTRWDERHFSGGETALMESNVLDYWRGHGHLQPMEQAALMRLEPARFNQLLVFDPRIPHGVKVVHGTRDPLEGRLVIHGWFKFPSLIVNGDIDRRAAEALALEAERLWQGVRQRFTHLVGCLIVRKNLGENSNLPSLKVLTNTLISTASGGDTPEAAVQTLLVMLASLNAPVHAKNASVTLPFRASAPAAP